MEIKLKSGIVVLALILLVTGCGMRDIDELAIVTAVGIDPGKDPNTVRLSAQIIRPADARGQTGAPSGGTGEPIYSIAAEGRTIFEAIRNMARFSSRRVYWAHNFIVVMNDEYAKRGVADMLDFFTRNHEPRMNTWVAVTSSEASELISTVTGLEVVPGQAIDNLFYGNEFAAAAPRTNLMRLQESYLSEVSHPVLARLELRNRGISNKKPSEHGSLKQVELAGAGVFKGDKFAGWLKPDETRMLLLFLERPSSIIHAVPCPGKEGSNATLEARKFDFRVIPRKAGAGGRIPSFDIRLKVQVDLVETGCEAPLKEIRSRLEKELAEQYRNMMQAVIGKAQKKYKADFLKLGETFHNRYPGEWKKISGRWEDIFPQVETEISVKVDLNNPVLKIIEVETK